jgi:heme oxygenase
MNAVRERLRARTSALHERVERTVLRLGLTSNEAGYRRYLEKLFRFHAPLEPELHAVAGLAELGLDLGERSKCEALLGDLGALGVGPRDLGPTTWCEHTPRILDVPGALGCLYVLEGATLGGQVLFRTLAEREPEVMRVASRYLRGYGAGTGQRWRAFLEALGTLADDERACLAAEESACTTFVELERWLGARAASSTRLVAES